MLKVRSFVLGQGGFELSVMHDTGERGDRKRQSPISPTISHPRLTCKDRVMGRS